MNKDSFTRLRKSSNKFIKGNIQLKPRISGADIVYSEDIELTNDCNQSVILNIRHHLKTKMSSFDFRLKGQIGSAICRLEVNAASHKGAGRTHKHELQDPDCLKNNLPYAYPCPELEAKTIVEQWAWLCTKANIQHEGRLLL